jgi:putative FmdB family regulatory protein
MPTYDYKCSECGHLFETMHSMKEKSLTTCPKCGKESLIRLIGGGGGMIFKGTGFYLTDYKKGSGGGAAVPPPAAPKSESKPAADSSAAPAKE